MHEAMLRARDMQRQQSDEQLDEEIFVRPPAGLEEFDEVEEEPLDIRRLHRHALPAYRYNAEMAPLTAPPPNQAKEGGREAERGAGGEGGVRFCTVPTVSPHGSCVRTHVRFVCTHARAQ